MIDINLKQTEQLKMLISDTFQEFYYHYKSSGIYAFVVELNKNFDIESFLISTQSSIFDHTENKQQYLLEDDKWNINKWKFKKEIYYDLQFNSSINNIYQNSLMSQIYDTAFYEQDLDEKREWIITTFQQAVVFLMNVYNLKEDSIIFLLKSTVDNHLLTEQAVHLNQASSLLFECIANIKIAERNEVIQTAKLSQLDKDLLIDLAQVVKNIEPYDSLSVAYQAYLFTLEGGFQDLSPHIQNLVNHIAALEGQEFALDRKEILDRINQFYRI